MNRGTRKSIFGTVNLGGVSIFRKPISTTTSEETNTLNRYLGYFHNLHRFVIQYIDEMLQNFSQSEFQELNENLTMDKYSWLSNKIINDAQIKNVSETFTYNTKLFNLYKTTIHNVLEGLLQSKTQYKILNSTKLELEKQKEKASILDDMEKLREYLEGIQKEMNLMDMNIKLDVIANIKPQYKRYINLYGMPENFVFDSEKLAVIVKDLIEEGVMEESDLFS